MSSVALGQEPPPAHPAARAAPETWPDSAWAAAALPDHPAGQEGAAATADCFCSLDFTPRDDCSGTGDQLSTQLYRNKQLQDTLLQKEEELARLQEENSHLRQFLNSALVKRLEEKTKALLWQNGQKLQRGLQSGKRRLKAEGPPVPREVSRPLKARRSLLSAFSACEDEPPNPPVDTWVLQTLGLKDLDTIDESPPAHHSALTADLRPGSFLLGPPDFGAVSGPPAAHGCGALAPRDGIAIGREEPWPCAPQLLSPCGYSLAPCALPCSSTDASPAQMDVAFTTSLSPHCNVKTHTFRQGQAFVRRAEDGGWKLTWVPKKPE